MQALIGVKKVQSQKFLENGRRIPVTLIDVKDNRVIAVKTNDRDHYQAVQLGFSMKKKATGAEIGHAKGANLEKAPKFLREVRIYDDSPLPEVGAIINPQEVFQPGDIVNVSGFSKGKGFAGGVKRYGFRGGPKTHGQSDRHRAPGSIGQGTTPGRVYKGKRMAGRMGNENVTIENLEIIDVNDSQVMIKGLVPGIINSLIFIKKVGEGKKFIPLYKDPEEVAADEAKAATEVTDGQGEEGTSAQTPPSGDAQPVSEGSPSEDPASLSGNQPTESEEIQKTDEGSVSDSPQEGPDAVSEKPDETEAASTGSEEVKPEAEVEAVSAGSEPASVEPEEVTEDAKS